jgi:hypothetical protein
VPYGFPNAARYSHTRWPTRAGSTPAPTASTTPAPSWFGTWKSAPPAIGVAPERDFQSVGLTPDTATRTRTCPGPGSGMAISSTRSTVGRGSGAAVDGGTHRFLLDGATLRSIMRPVFWHLDGVS